MSKHMEELPLDEQALLGTWCAFSSYWLGYVATDEFTFTSDGKFLWREWDYDEATDDFDWARIEGTWRLEDEQLKLDFEKKDSEYWPQRRLYFYVTLRYSKLHDQTDRRQLVLKSSLGDDEVHEKGEHGTWLFPYEVAPGEAQENHDALKAKRKRGNRIDGPFKELVSLLIKEAPPAVERLQIPEPLFCVRLYFHDTHAPRDGYCTWVRCLTESTRQRVMKTARPIDVPDELWHPTSGIANGSPVADSGLFEADLSQSEELIRLYQRIYGLLEEDEDENAMKLRAALRQTALTLHMLPWPKGVLLTDDFVVFPADGSNHFAGEYKQDMQVSVPKKRLELLAKRGYLAADD